MLIGNLSVKWLYKDLFDLNMSINKVYEISSLRDIELILNLQIINILSKLRKELNYSFEKEISYNEIKLRISKKNGAIVVEKWYGDGFYINNGDGDIKIYEPILYDTEKITYQDGKEVYIGHVINNKPNGKGTYYYRSTTIEGYLNSNDLVDKNAEKITKLLKMNNIETNIFATIKGTFKEGIIEKGKIEISKDGEIKIIEI